MQHKDSADITGKDVDSYFEESSQKRSYNCYNCNKSLSKITDCYPEKQESENSKTIRVVCFAKIVSPNMSVCSCRFLSVQRIISG